jgi:hypothetical protein
MVTAAATNAAVDVLTCGVAVELAPIRVNYGGEPSPEPGAEAWLQASKPIPKQQVLMHR